LDERAQGRSKGVPKDELQDREFHSRLLRQVKERRRREEALPLSIIERS
jgi:hypothetical protein